ncbi:MAG: family 43 glycosylhydrolase [Anaerocolumna sp.]
MLKLISGSIKILTMPKKLSLIALLTVIFLAPFSTICFAQNPAITSIYTADPSAHVWADGKIYIYASHDIDPNQGCDLMDKYHVYSSSDMVNWTDEGEILNASQVPWGRPEGGFMWAPDCAYKNGTYYFYFPHPSGTDWGSTWKVGVATSNKPASDFTVQGYIPGLESLIDPCVFQDEDGQAYLYYGGGGVCKGGKLKDNMVEIDGTMQTMAGLTDFHEATWVFKRNGLYYLTYADNHSDSTGDNRLQYATSTSPLGPWTSRGVYMDPTDSYCAHGSVVQYKGQWYQFYFDSSVSGNDWLRTTCVDKLNFNADGTIQKVIQTTTGVPSVGPAPTPNPGLIKYEAENAVLGNGATVGADRATIDIYYAANDTSKLSLTLNGVNYSFLNAVSTGGWSNYSGHTYLTVPLNPGTANTIKLTGGNGGVNIDYITISSFNDTGASAAKYEVESGTLANGVIAATDSAASGGKYIQNMHLTNASCRINNIDGGSGGSKTIKISYASGEVSTITVYVNGTSAGTLNCPATGGWSTFTGSVQKAVTLNSGTGNHIQFVGGNGGINLDYITIQ